MGTTLDITKTQKNASRIYFGLAIPAATSYLTIGADGVPDATENPLAKLIGLTEKGATIHMSRTITEEYYDEVKYALERNIDQVGASIKCEANQVLDPDLLTIATVGVGSALTPSGKKAWTLGEGTLAFTAVAVIAPTKNDATKFVVFMLYKAFNKSDVDMVLSRTERSKIGLEFEGVGIATRAVTDTFGQLYITI
jgi:hypothetical protein